LIDNIDKKGDKKVLLIFIQADSGVDGTSSLEATAAQHNIFSSLKDAALSNIIRRAQFAIPPLALMILSSQKVAGVTQSICDLRFEKLPLNEHWDMAGISVQTGAVRPAFQLADALRARGIKVVLGGPYVTIFPDNCRDHADALVIGEADDIWREVQYNLLAGTLKSEYRVETFPDLSIERLVEKDALDIKRYFTTNVIQTTRGCPYSCDFCNVHVMNGHRLRHKALPDVLREVEHSLSKDKRIFFFLDDTINADEHYAEKLFNELERFKIHWVGQATTALGEKPRLLDAFARSGCGALLIGIESLTDGSNHAHKKFHNPAARQVECISNIRKAGICVYGSFIYGLDEDTLELPAKLEAFIEETGVDVPGINLLRPIPGTGVFNRLAHEGRLLHSPDDHDAFKFSWGQEMLYKPLRIPLQEFIPSYTALTSRVFTVQNAVKRAMRAPRLRSAVLMFNLLYVHMYGMARKDLLRQLGEMEK